MSRADELIQKSSPEAELLFRLSRTTLDDANRQAIHALLETPIDWSAFLASVERNYVAPLVHESLASLASTRVPRKVMETLRVRTKITTWKNQEFASELVRLQSLFESHSIQVLHYKGPTAAIGLYGDLSRRTFNDMDFLVRRRDLDHTLALLEEAGYRHTYPLTRKEVRLFIKEQKEFLLSRDNIQLEPHFSLTARRYPFEIDYEGLWDRSALLPYRNTMLRVLCPEDNLLVLAMVAAKGKWKRLQQLTDIAECLRTHPDPDWDIVVTAAREAGCERILLLSLLLSHALMGIQIPESLREQAMSSNPVLRLAEDITLSFSQPAAVPRFLPDLPNIFSPMLWAMRERSLDKASYLLRTSTTPTPLHTRRMPLPAGLFFLYRILVPVHDYLLVPAYSVVRHLIYGSRNTGQQVPK